MIDPRDDEFAGRRNEGNAILHNGNSYIKNLTLARLGILPFFIIASVVVWVWTRALYGDLAALFAALLFTSLPPVLAHAGLATTDMAVTALFLCTLYTFTRWLRQPSAIVTLLFGLSFGFAVLSKFTTFIFMPACVLALLISLWLTKRPDRETLKDAIRRRAKPLTISLMLASLVIWAGYRFSVAPLARPEDRPHRVIGVLGIDRVLAETSSLRHLLYELIEQPVPVPSLVEGLRFQWNHNANGHEAYLLGENRTDGWWYFFIVVLAVKTPLAFLLLVGAGIQYIVRSRKEWSSCERSAPMLCAASILIASLPSRMNLGVRHILAIYPLLAIIAGYGVAAVFVARKRIVITLGLALLLWHSVSSALAHPDYLAYFNEFAGASPEKIVADSDLDWGQDLDRLSKKLRQLGVERVTLAYFGTADLTRHALPPFKTLAPYQPTSGWIAISEYSLKIQGKIFAQRKGQSVGAFDWLENYQPIARVGKSIRLYYISDAEVVKAGS